MFETLLQNRTVQVLIESFPRILLPGLAVTIPLTVLAFALGLVIASAVALVQFAHVPVLRQLDHGLGALLGLVQGVLIVGLLCFCAQILGPLGLLLIEDLVEEWEKT